LTFIVRAGIVPAAASVPAGHRLERAVAEEVEILTEAADRVAEASERQAAASERAAARGNAPLMPSNNPRPDQPQARQRQRSLNHPGNRAAGKLDLAKNPACDTISVVA
jgi:hypothetical protein